MSIPIKNLNLVNVASNRKVGINFKNILDDDDALQVIFLRIQSRINNSRKTPDDVDLIFLKNLIKAVKYAILCLKEEDFNGSAQSMRNILDGRENDYTFLISEKAAEEIINSIKFKKTGDFYINFLIKFSISILAYSESGGVITL